MLQRRLQRLVQVYTCQNATLLEISCQGLNKTSKNKGDLAIRRVFSLVGMITKPKFSNCPNVFKIGLFR